MWEQIGTDSMRLQSRPLELVVQANLPTLDGAAVSVLDHEERVEAGFRRMYARSRPGART